MAVMKHYFEYKGQFFATYGIPYINLQWTLTDWKSILEKLKQLSNINSYFYSERIEEDIQKNNRDKKRKNW